MTAIGNQPATMSVMDVHAVFDETAAAIAAALDDVADWGLAGTVPGQHHSDIAADAAAVKVLTGAGFGVLSEESGLHFPERDVVVVVDPLDGSTNAFHGIPWYAVSLCAVDADGARNALVVNLSSGRRFSAERGAGAFADGVPLVPSTTERLLDSLLVLSGIQPPGFLSRQWRVLGAVALDLCAVAEGVIDGYIDWSPNAHAPWDYLGGLLICREAGVCIGDAFDREMTVIDHAARRTPVAAGTASLFEALLEARRAFEG
jgi:fructose-1,6-bisphosphatase/inositol monophosphatase family enzyme